MISVQRINRIRSIHGVGNFTQIQKINPQSLKRFASNRTKVGIEDQSKAGTITPSNNNLATTTRNRKLTPAAKAKAQASASRALREQLQATKIAGLENEKVVENGLNSPINFNSSSIIPKSFKKSFEQNNDQQQQQNEESNQTLLATNTTPTIRRIRDVYAYATAESYNFDILIGSGRLPNQWQLIEDGNVIYIPHWPGKITTPPLSPINSENMSGVGEAFIFRSGSYVTWGISYEQSKKFLRSVIQGRPNTGGSSEVKMYSEIGDEEMEYIIAEDQITRVVGDVIVIGQKPRAEEELEGDYVDDTVIQSGEPEEPDWSPLLARLAFSQGLTRSARLSVQEAALTKYLEEVADMPTRLEAEGKVPLPRRQVIRKMGTLLKLRQSANLDTENFLDDPEMYWENGELEHHYDSICQTLDIESRFKAYNAKLDHGENLLGVLRALLTESSTHRMELIIIYLIAFEVCLALISHEYIPSPEMVRDYIMNAFNGGGDSLKDLPQSTDLTNNKTSMQTHQSQNTTSYWRWLLNHIPGFRQQNQPQPIINSGHLI